VRDGTARSADDVVVELWHQVFGPGEAADPGKVPAPPGPPPSS
jgi:hypothetical protein